MSEAVAVAHPNVALSKYWGKRAGAGNFPAVPSLSVAMSDLSTRTCVRFDPRASDDRVAIGGRAASLVERGRVVALLDRVRTAAGTGARAVVTSESDFPMASGLASSASGFAALALAAVRAAGLDWDAARVSDLARQSSASAARSLFAGFVELPAGPLEPIAGEVLAARAVAPADQLPLVVVVAVATEKPKSVGSTEGMLRTMERSPYAAAWLAEAPRRHDQVRAALAARDFRALGESAEASAMAMHAAALAAGVTYWSGVTLDTLDAVRALRAGGVAVYASIDAGPHVKALVQPDDVSIVQAALGAVPGVVRVIATRVGDGPKLVTQEASS